MRVGDTIIARSSPPGRSPRALIRLSGPDAHWALARLAPSHPAPPSPSSPSESPPPRCLVTRLRLGPATLPALLMRSTAPRTATGEDTAELLLPGNPTLVDRVIQTVIAASAGRVRLAEPGEFSARAFLNGRLDLVQAEGVARLIAARSEGERHATRRLITGAQTAIYTDLSARVARLLALVEAGIDFTDQEDVVAISPRDLADGLDAILQLIDNAIGNAAPREATNDRPRVVLVGPPNAGKSSLFNALLGRGRAVVSPSPGSTRDVLVEPLDLSHDVPGGPTVDLCDLAGLDRSPTASPSAQAAQHAALGEIAAADVLVLCDPHGQFETLEALLPAPPHEQRVLRLRTKGDLPLAPSDDSSGGAGEARSPLTVCALDGWHLPALRRAIADSASTLEPTGEVLPRHRAAMAHAAQSLTRTRAAIDPSAHHLRTPERLAAGLREALDALGQITGRTTPDDILGRIFSSFCVGK